MESGIAITGMSGRFPEADNVAEFAEKLYNKINLVTESTKRWEPGFFGLPKLLGQIKDISKFDAGFFNIHHKQAHHLDPQARILLEVTYEAIIDAGYNPVELRGKNIGVFIGNTLSESGDFFSTDINKVSGYSMAGCAQSMFANRISFCFDFKGPSIVIDTACSSGARAFCEAVNAIRRNECEAAIVGGANLCLKPATTMKYYRLNVLSKEGVCRSFDAEGDGYVRSEAVVSLFLQKSAASRRLYASVVHVKTNTDGFKEEGITFPSVIMHSRLLQETYHECNLDPLNVSYVETHAAGTPVGDPVEMAAISSTFCNQRKEPLLVGSVKTNMGHSESVAGLCGIVKVLIAMETRLMPPNLHFKTPNPNIPDLFNGKVKIVTDSMPWKGKYAAINSFGFGGVNVHIILKSNPNEQATTSGNIFPQLVLYSGRTRESIGTLFDYLNQQSVPRDFFALLHKSAYLSPKSKSYRGYKIINEGTESFDIKQLSASKRQVWYVFSGVGSQWLGAAKDLMDLKVFSKTIHKLAETLKPLGLDLVEILTKDMTTTATSKTVIPVNVSITAMQVALVDVLRELGIQPDGIIGHSVGELGCAYADGCLTAEQTVLAAYWRGKSLEGANLTAGAMAAVGLTWEDAKQKCPKSIFPSCHNAKDSITISGPKEEIQSFMERLKEEKVFVREVETCGYAFHCPCIFPAADKLQISLEKLIIEPKRRTSRWISSSFSKENLNDPASKFASADYFVYNMRSPVLFYEALKQVPEDAIVIEVAPHQLLQAILKRVIGPKADIIGLLKRQANAPLHLLSSIGRMYTSGLNPDIEKLYPAVSFPVARGTPMISSLMMWDHSESWTVAKWGKDCHHTQMIVEIDIGAPDSKDAFIADYCIDGRKLYPASGYLMLAWKALAELKSTDISLLPVIFKCVKIHRATVVSTERVTKFVVDVTFIESMFYWFEISEAGAIVATGRMFDSVKEPEIEGIKYWKDSATDIKLNTSDIYKELRIIGYEYGRTFQKIVESNLEGDQGLLKWSDNWIVFIESLLQFGTLFSDRTLRVPTGFSEVSIHPPLQRKFAEATNNLGGIPIIFNQKTKRIIAGGVEIKHVETAIAPRQPVRQIPLLEERNFVPNFQSKVLSKVQKKRVETYINICSSIAKKVLQSAGKSKDQIFAIMNNFHEVEENSITSYLQNLSEEHVLLKKLQQMYFSAGSEWNKLAKLTLLNYFREREMDILETTLVRENPLRTVLDIVMENIKPKKLNIFEVYDGYLPFSIKIHDILETFHATEFNYMVAHPNPDILDVEALTPMNLKFVKWSSNNNGTVPDVSDVELLVFKNLNCSEEELRRVLQNFSAVLKLNGFLLVLQRTKLSPAEAFLSTISEVSFAVHSEGTLEKIFKDLNLPVVAKKSDGIISCMYLLRNAHSPSCQVNDSVITVKSENCFEELKTELSKIHCNSENRRIWLAVENGMSSDILESLNGVRQEPGGDCIRIIFLDPETSLPNFNLKNVAFQQVLNADLIVNVYKNKEWGTFRRISLETEKKTIYTEHAYLSMLTRGDLSSLKWFESPLKYHQLLPSPNIVFCQVYYAALNYRDVMLASGKLSSDTISGNVLLQDGLLGLEFSGRNSKGERVMGLVENKGIATSVAVRSHFVWTVPDDWTLEEASTVPVAYSTAYYALIIRGNLKRGEKVLIHSGSCVVGQASIAICLALGCKMFISIDSNEQQTFLKNRFQQLSDEDFHNSEDATFEDGILNSTSGKGVDVILNSLEGQKFKVPLHCLAKHGRFLEIGKYISSQDSPLDMEIFSKNRSFQSISLEDLFKEESCNVFAKIEVVGLVSQGIEDGTVKPLNSMLFDKIEAEQAFRYMASGHHIEKVVLKIRQEEVEKIVLPTPIQIPALPRIIFNPTAVYIIIGGLDGFGLELCHWLIGRGAINIVLTSDTGIQSGYQHLCLKRWESQFINIIVSTLNIADHNKAMELLKMALNHGPIGGIFNLALLDDVPIEDQTTKHFRLLCESRIQSILKLDTLSRELCHNLTWFVCFQLINGSPKQKNAKENGYSYTNSTIERICEKRKQDGFPGLAIRLGAMCEVVIVEDGFGEDTGIIPQKLSSCLEVLDRLLQHDYPVVSSFVPYRPKENPSQKSQENNVLTTVANLFGIKDIRTINLEHTLSELGMDSLIAVEIQQFLERECKMNCSVEELRQLKMKDIKNLKGASKDNEYSSIVK